ncbi:MAG: gamma-glutamylcyclotransferase [Deltaproteobacteria bacterium]|nr:MAG: gamma-glutamylcyclotransferase [Deltaproteobacteria bacterium]
MAAVDKLFVYGTLMSGNRARTAFSALFRGPGQRAWLLGRLYHLPEGYPTLVLDTGGTRVAGELLHLNEVDGALSRLDAYEGHDPEDRLASLYVRVVTTVNHEDGESKAWVYVCPPHLLTEVETRGALVEDGDWRAYLRRRRPPL